MPAIFSNSESMVLSFLLRIENTLVTRPVSQWTFSEYLSSEQTLIMTLKQGHYMNYKKSKSKDPPQTILWKTTCKSSFVCVSLKRKTVPLAPIHFQHGGGEGTVASLYKPSSNEGLLAGNCILSVCLSLWKTRLSTQRWITAAFMLNQQSRAT